MDLMDTIVGTFMKGTLLVGTLIGTNCSTNRGLTRLHSFELISLNIFESF